MTSTLLESGAISVIGRPGRGGATPSLSTTSIDIYIKTQGMYVSKYVSWMTSRFVVPRACSRAAENNQLSGIRPKLD